MELLKLSFFHISQMAKELVEEKLEMSRVTEHLEEQMFELKNKVICKKNMEKLHFSHSKP